MRKTRILVADDDVRLRQRLKRLLASSPHLEVVDEAYDGNEAVHKALQLEPDVLVLDIRMPRLNGFEVSRQLTTTLPALKIVILTAFDLQEYRDEALACGAHAFVPKRAMLNQLLPELESLSFSGDGSDDVHYDEAGI